MFFNHACFSLIQVQVDRFKSNPAARRTAIDNIKVHGKRRRVDTSRPDGVLGLVAKPMSSSSTVETMEMGHATHSNPTTSTNDTDVVGSVHSTTEPQHRVDGVAVSPTAVASGHAAKSASTLRQAARVAIFTVDPPLYAAVGEEEDGWPSRLPRAQGYRLAPLPFDVTSTPLATLRYKT